jgi:hypothetical protein
MSKIYKQLGINIVPAAANTWTVEETMQVTYARNIHPGSSVAVEGTYQLFNITDG